MWKKCLIVSGLCLILMGMAVLGCEPDNKNNYDCNEAVDLMYEEGCELWCQSDVDWIYLATCGWYDDGGAENFSQSMAESLCEDFESAAENADCEDQLQDLTNCLVKKRRDACADDCQTVADDFWSCVG